MNEELLRLNREIRKSRPVIKAPYTVYENNGVFQLCFRSKGCANYLSGQCIMCDYGVGTNIDEKELESSFNEAMALKSSNARTILLNTYGSVLDTRELSENCFDLLLSNIKETDFNNVIFETHYNTITEEKLEKIRRILDKKNISIELGFETSNEYVREKNLLKKIDNSEFIKVVDLIHSFDMEVIVNILIGIPFLSEEEQFNDALNSIIYADGMLVDDITLFPINIKPYTLLKECYDKNMYEAISHWLVIEVLRNIPSNILNKIHLAWYGNRELPYENGIHSIMPRSCPKCYHRLMTFYELFNKNREESYRTNLINDLIDNSSCDCHENLLKRIKKIY